MVKKNATPKCTHRDYPYIFWASASEKKKGVLLAISKSVTFNLKSSLLDDDGGYINLTGDVNSKLYTIASTYAPNSQQLRFLRKIFKLISSVRYGQLLMCGDFNVTVDPHLDCSSTTKERRLSPLDLFHTEGVYDVWWCQHACERNYTFFSARQSIILMHRLILDRQMTPSEGFLLLYP